MPCLKLGLGRKIGFNLVKYYQFYDRYIVIHTHIFSDKGKILAGQFVLYNLIWAGFVWLTYLLFRYIKKDVRRKA